MELGVFSPALGTYDASLLWRFGGLSVSLTPVASRDHEAQSPPQISPRAPLTQGPMTPQVSVVMPVRNGARWLSEAVDSVLAQTFSDWELIVIDDGSTDATPSILAAFASRDPRIRVI